MSSVTGKYEFRLGETSLCMASQAVEKQTAEWEP
jgi:hypothetical protein